MPEKFISFFFWAQKPSFSLWKFGKKRRRRMKYSAACGPFNYFSDAWMLKNTCRLKWAFLRQHNFYSNIIQHCQLFKAKSPHRHFTHLCLITFREFGYNHLAVICFFSPWSNAIKCKKKKEEKKLEDILCWQIIQKEKKSVSIWEQS